MLSFVLSALFAASMTSPVYSQAAPDKTQTTLTATLPGQPVVTMKPDHVALKKEADAAIYTSEKAVAAYTVADRNWAYLEQATDEISTLTKNVGGMWFRTWRTGGVSDEYLRMALRMEELSKYASDEKLTATSSMLYNQAAKFREIAQLVSLGGTETVADGTGEYTVRIANAIQAVHKDVGDARKLANESRRQTFSEAAKATRDMEATLQRIRGS